MSEDAERDLVYIKLPESLGPLDRGDRYEDPLQEALQQLGEITGGGSQLGREKVDGSRDIEFCGIDVHTYDVAAVRKLLHHTLPALGRPAGTEIHYATGDEPRQDEFDGSRWVLDRPRSMLHPYFRS